MCPPQTTGGKYEPNRFVTVETRHWYAETVLHYKT